MSKHVVPLRIYFAVFAALCGLLVVTVAVALIDLGPLNVAVAMSIAIAKTALIVLYFMHLRYAGGLTRIFAVAGFVWLAILIGITLSDYLTRT